MAKHRFDTPRSANTPVVFRYGGRANGTGGVFVRYKDGNLEPLVGPWVPRRPR
ncbi:hypothetical protein SEA_ICEMAN_37 [Mycobacterium phage Iceman]|uniref:Uncharacterized protein n=7 Tax=Backyardiganvirus peaches TaxID=663557 RepID=A0A1B1SE16_9CAUD|nr:hypothetical protein PBI_GADOST_36 [Mycobacterium phage Gadost]AMS01412.1 hypothetical protein SEA_ROMNEY_36 [Mycobacterium phage Romney]ANU78933.1 hypothetical protein SEA_WILBUR_36 [Mycobacterium phage Wilbur]APC43444.1 hypothetical protein SEA_BROSEIDON_36 [Mycobacterium phage Broseidon]APC44215.1 hypothetical protein SEA_ALBEE_36 [Mycobacterium phage Albee]QDF17090.1 hypothetical protein SEA_TYGERBLOOD_36 [Mycobacterium phage TygerBlood]QKO03183.1 hypothetical protein SEA_SCAMP_36 [Myc